LSSTIDPNPPLLNWKFGKLEPPFNGILQGNKFTISKILSGSSIPLHYIYGEIKEHGEGSSIHMIIRPPGYIIAFTIFLNIMILTIGFIPIIFTRTPTWPVILFPLGALLASYIIPTAVFKFQASFAKDDLRDIFEIEKA
jgi:hypothetical protein